MRPGTFYRGTWQACVWCEDMLQRGLRTRGHTHTACSAPSIRKQARRSLCQRLASASQRNPVLGRQGKFPRGCCSCMPGVNGSPGDPRGRVVRIAPSWKRLELQSETHRHGNKGNNAAPRLTALFPIFPSITFLGLSHSNSDKSHKNCKCGSPRLPGG